MDHVTDGHLPETHQLLKDDVYGLYPFAKVALHPNLAFPWDNVSSAQPKDELHFDVHFVGKWGPERSDDLSRDSSLGAGAGNPPPAALPGSRV